MDHYKGLPSDNSFPTRPGVPTAIETFVFARYLAWSTVLKCLANSCDMAPKSISFASCLVFSLSRSDWILNR